MLTHMQAVETGAHLPNAKEIEDAKLVACSYRNQRHPGTRVRCEFVSARLGVPHCVDYVVCKMCQINGTPSAANPFIKYLICHLAFDRVIAGPTATIPKAPTDDELAIAIGVIIECHDKEKARGFVDALIYHESITAAKGAELVAEHDLLAASR